MSDTSARERRRRALGLSLCACGLYTASLPPFEVWWLAPAAPFALGLFLLDPRNPLDGASAAWAGLLFGELTTLAVGGHWLFLAANGFFQRSVAFSLLFTLVITLTHAGLFLAAAVLCSARLARLGAAARIAGFASVWVAWEWVRANILYGCPWDFVGHALSTAPLLMQASALGGVYLLSWACVAVGGAVAVAVIERRRLASAWGALGFAAAVMLAWAGYGRAVLAGGVDARSGLQPLRVGLVQANVGRRELWKSELRSRHLNRSLELSRSPALHGADLIVWAENAVPFLLDADAGARRAIHALAEETGAALLVGAPRSESTGDGRARFYNSMYLFTPGRTGYRTYDKQKLLPYIEATPAWARETLGRPAGIEYSPGDPPGLFDVKGWKIAPLICFESTYPALARRAAAAGADLLVNVSNDSWFDGGAAPGQHFAMTRFRASENRLPLVRVANTGVSGVTDAFGRTRLLLAARSEQVGLLTVPAPARVRPPYSRHGDLFALAAIASALLLLGWSVKRGGR